MASTGTAATSAEKKNGKNTAATDVKETAATDVKEMSAAKKNESVYKAGELAAGAEEAFGTTPECVAAALGQAGITECTKEEAARIVKEFRERKVG